MPMLYGSYRLGMATRFWAIPTSGLTQSSVVGSCQASTAGTLACLSVFMETAVSLTTLVGPQTGMRKAMWCASSRSIPARHVVALTRRSCLAVIQRLQIRVEAFNVTNTQRLGQYDTSRGGFGVTVNPETASPPTQWSNFTAIQGTPRVLQFGFRFEF